VSSLIQKERAGTKYQPRLGLNTVALIACIGSGAIVAGCAKNVENQSTVVSSVPSATNPVVDSFFGSYLPLLHPGQHGQAAMIYVNPAANWKQYDKILLQPVQFRDDPDTQIPTSDQLVLTGYFYNQLKTELQKSFTLVDQAGPGVLQLEVALTGASAATPGLRTISVVLPQARILNLGQSLATGSYAFAGSAKAETKATDSSTGQFLAGAIDKRAGGMASSMAAQWHWGDAENAMNYWAHKIVTRLLEFQGRQPPGQ
jgi:hypothetical protein